MKPGKIWAGCSVVCILIGIFLTFAVMDGATLLAAADKKFLGDRHIDKGIDCDGCHNESPPKALVPTKACLKCHGTYDDLAERTKKVDPNPHASHRGDLPCETCHHAHKESVNRCGACHDFDFKVP
jgi:fumarate reductase flavoprotein subunit